MASPTAELTRAEEQVMHILWQRGPSHVKEVQAALPAPAPALTTVSTIVRILEQKGFVGYEPVARSYRYHARMAQDEYRRFSLCKLLRGHFGGSFGQLLSFFAQEENLDAAQLDALLRQARATPPNEPDAAPPGHPGHPQTAPVMSLDLPPLAAWLVATVLPLGALWLLFRVALRPERCFGYNRVLLLLSPLLAAGLPLLPRPAVSFWPGPGAASAAGSAVGATVLLPTVPASSRGGTTGWAGWPWLLGLYGAGVALGLARLGWRRWQLRRATRALSREQRDGYVLARTAGCLPTSSFGRTIFWDDTADLTPAEAAAVLAHEQAHVRQGHTYDVLWLEIWRAVLWPNPFAHRLLPALRLTHELLADREAAAHWPTPGDPATAPVPAPYPALLARLAVQGAAGPTYTALLQPFTFSFTLTRLAMLQNQTPVRRWKQWLVLPVLGGLSLVACQPNSVPPGPPPSPQLVEPATPLPFFSAEQKAVRRARVREALRNDSVQHVGQDMSSERQTVLFMDDGTVRIVWGPKSPHRIPPGVYTFVEHMPELPGGGGYTAIAHALQANVVHPNAAALGAPGTGNTPVRLAGRVFVSFTVGADGVVRDADVIKALDPAYDAAVLAAVHKLPGFTPGQQAGKPVAVNFTFPVQFTP